MNGKPRLVVAIEQLCGGDANHVGAQSQLLARNMPDLASAVFALEYDHPRFREPANGEWVVGLYRSDDGKAAPLLLWADTREDRFWDAARREHVKPPKFYIRLTEQPQIDPRTGYPIIDGAVCPF